MQNELDKKKLGYKIKRFRKQKGLTQQEFAEKIDISEKHVSKIEQGVYLPSLANFIKMVRILSVDFEQFEFFQNKNQDNTRKKLTNIISEATNEECECFLSMILSIRNLIAKKK